MVNAWSLAASILNGTFDEDYPIVKKEVDEKTGLWKEPDPVEHSDYYYDYKRNDPDAENPFTDPKDKERAEKVVADIDDMYAHHFIDDTMMGTISIGGTESFDLMPYPYTMPDTLSPQMRQEIKDIINEVLDERLKHK